MATETFSHPEIDETSAVRPLGADPPVLQVRGLTKFFGATRALHNVDLTISRGEIHALLGENGAGKSTLIKILAGVHVPDRGELLLSGEPIQPWFRRGRLPISFIHQDLGLIDTMTVAENIALTTSYALRRQLISWSSVNRRAHAVLEGLGAAIAPERRISSLSAAERSIVAIARALAQNCRLLILDEPTATLPQADVERLFGVLGRLRREGIGIVYVTHRLDEVFRLADRVSVLRNGKCVASTRVMETSPEELVLEIIGKPPAEVFIEPPPAHRAVALDVLDLGGGGVGPISLRLAEGEILGLVGRRGAGHDIVGRMLFGMVPRESGTVHRHGIALPPGSIDAAMSAGLGFVSSRRNEESLAGPLTVRENLFLNPHLRDGHSVNRFSPRDEKRRAKEVMARFSIRPPDAGERIVTTLSGGNAQKVVLARWFEMGSEILILEEPTMGVDVGAKAEIYGMIQEDLRRGHSVLLVSSDFEEVARISHRALVLVDGRISAEVSGENLSVEALTRLASVAGG
ncbi:MAG TPA: sugar ABC transporter ATP-binding protein [Acetobacteraceae bacterium]|nr:sugar ABC transporter ATP-binding protein [Acetobacteraceae bacterium]